MTKEVMFLQIQTLKETLKKIAELSDEPSEKELAEQADAEENGDICLRLDDTLEEIHDLAVGALNQ